MTTVPHDVERLIRAVPGWTSAPLRITPLPGGVAQRTWSVEVGGRAFVVRIPAERAEVLGIDRSREVEAASRAAELGLGPPVAGVLPRVGTPVTELVPGRRATADDVRARLGEVVGAVRCFQRSEPLSGAYPVHRVVEWHVRDAGTHGVFAPSSYERLHQQSRRIEHAFAASPTPPVPSHDELVPSNLLLAEHGVLLLDFEHAGMNDQFFDLATLSVSCGFTNAEDEQLLLHAFTTFTRSAWARLQLMKVMSEFRTGMWAVLQQAITTLDTDFAAVADEHLRRCEHLVSSPSFETWLEDARRPPLHRS